MLYYPEMGQQAAKRLFRTFHNHGDTYCVEWLPQDDEQARAAFKHLRIRPRFIQFNRRGFELTLQAKSDKWTCLVTGAAHSKLFDVDLCAHEILLD